MRLYRPHRGNFDAWRRYRVVFDGVDVHHIADTQLLTVDGSNHRLSVSVGPYSSGDVEMHPTDGQVVICELAANPDQTNPPMRLSLVSESELQERLLRFDAPPYVGGRLSGVTRAIASTVIAAAIAIAALFFCILLILRFAHPNGILGLLFVGTVGTIVWFGFGFAAASGLRAFYYYFRLPRPWRH